MMVGEISGWGRYPRIRADICHFDDSGTLRDCLVGAGETIPYGMGRSYGDSALNHRVIATRRFNAILAFDSDTGVVTCESGVSLAELVEVFLPRGWFPAVVPGTKFITVGGAIASDVHGKNHHLQGCFSQQVLELQLMLADGHVLRCSPIQNRELFCATCGGMGLTGFILAISLQLQRIPSALIRQIVVPTRNIDEALEAFEAHSHWSYSVAWIDCLASAENLGRSLLILGEHAPAGPLRLGSGRQWQLPFALPGFLLNQTSVRLFNALYFHTKARRMAESVISLRSFFFPLDVIHQWNLIYGRRGFTQYQLVLPKEAGCDGLKQILRRVSRSGMGSFLAVLKLMGAANDNHLSFPLEGYTLALDFKIEKRLFELLDELDRVVADHGGRLYLAKDVRMSAAMFRRGYPRWQQFRALRKGLGLHRKLVSMQSKRLGI
jgi:decaprenylphospho-beta-D-ribofuranose 2-oxidase